MNLRRVHPAVWVLLTVVAVSVVLLVTGAATLTLQPQPPR